MCSETFIEEKTKFLKKNFHLAVFSDLEPIFEGMVAKKFCYGCQSFLRRAVKPESYTSRQNFFGKTKKLRNLGLFL